MKRTAILLLLILCCVLTGCKEETPTAPADDCANGHLPGDWAVILEASATMSGMRQRVCERCNATVETEEIPKLNTSVPDGPATPSSPGGGSTPSDPSTPEEPPVIGGEEAPPIEMLLVFEELGDQTLGVRAANQWVDEITVPETYNGKRVTCVLPSGFAGCTVLTHISLPDTLTEIGAAAFSGCAALAEINLPSALTRVGAAAFNGCTALPTHTAYNAVMLGNILLAVEPIGVSYFGLGSSVTLLADDAFAALPALEALYLPASLVSVGGALGNAPALTQVFTDMTATAWAAVAGTDALPSGVSVYTQGTWGFAQGVPVPLQ